MTVTILKIKYVSEDTLFEYGSLPFEFDVFHPVKATTKADISLRKASGPCKRKQQVKWSEDDDRILRLYAEKEYSWKEIASNFLHDKFTPQQLHQRWKRVLNDTINREPWSDEEDKAIVEYVKRNGCSWSKLRTLLGTRRTDTMVRQRWLKITNGQGEIGVPNSKQSKPNDSINMITTNSSNIMLTNESNSPPTTSNAFNSFSNLLATSLNGMSDMDVFQFMKNNNLIPTSMPTTQVNIPIMNKPKTPLLSADALTCDEDLTETITTTTTTSIRPVPSEPSHRKDSMDFSNVPSSSFNVLLENNVDLVDFHSSLQNNLEKEWLNQIFNTDF